MLFEKETYAILGAAIEVYNQLGPGFLEAVYQEALEIEFNDSEIPFNPQAELHIHFKGRQLKKSYITDFLAYDQILVEIKALDNLSSMEEAQLLNQLKATGCPLGLLINFGHSPKLEWKRRANTKSKQMVISFPDKE